MIKLKEVLNREFKARGLSIAGVSRDLKIPRSVLHSWKNGVFPSGANLIHIKSLAEYLNISVAMLLFNVRDETKSDSILFNSEFRDGKVKYKLIIEKEEH